MLVLKVLVLKVLVPSVLAPLQPRTFSPPRTTGTSTLSPLGTVCPLSTVAPRPPRYSALTGAPSAIFWMPDTISRSPAFRPPLTT